MDQWHAWKDLRGESVPKAVPVVGGPLSDVQMKGHSQAQEEHDQRQAIARRDWLRKCRESPIDGEDRAYIDARVNALEGQTIDRERLKEAQNLFAPEKDRPKRNVLTCSQ